MRHKWNHSARPRKYWKQKAKNCLLTVKLIFAEHVRFIRMLSAIYCGSQLFQKLSPSFQLQMGGVIWKMSGSCCGNCSVYCVGIFFRRTRCICFCIIQLPLHFFDATFDCVFSAANILLFPYSRTSASVSLLWRRFWFGFQVLRVQHSMFEAAQQHSW